MKEEQVEYLEGGLLGQAFRVQRNEPRDGIVHQVELNVWVIKLGLNVWQEAVLAEDLLQDRGLRPHTVHFDVVFGWHVCFNDHHQGPECVLFLQDLPEAEHQEVESLNVTYGWIAPDVGLNDPRDRLLDLCSVELVVWEGT